jgi:hypothetical protein
MHQALGETAVRRIMGVLSLGKKYGVARVDDACAAALEVGTCDYRFVRRYLERNPQPPLSLRQIDFGNLRSIATSSTARPIRRTRNEPH